MKPGAWTKLKSYSGEHVLAPCRKSTSSESTSSKTKHGEQRNSLLQLGKDLDIQYTEAYSLLKLHYTSVCHCFGIINSTEHRRVGHRSSRTGPCNKSKTISSGRIPLSIKSSVKQHTELHRSKINGQIDNGSRSVSSSCFVFRPPLFNAK